MVGVPFGPLAFLNTTNKPARIELPRTAYLAIHTWPLWSPKLSAARGALLRLHAK